MTDTLGVFVMIKKCLFAGLLAKDGFVTIHTRTLQILATEIFKV